MKLYLNTAIVPWLTTLLNPFLKGGAMRNIETLFLKRGGVLCFNHPLKTEHQSFLSFY
jgi:hypothetical protein